MTNTINDARFVPGPRTYYTCMNGTRLLEVDQDTIKVQPLLKKHFSNGFPDVWVDVSWNDGQGGRHVDRDSPKISVFVSDDLKYQGGPFNSPRSEPKKTHP